MPLNSEGQRCECHGLSRVDVVLKFVRLTARMKWNNISNDNVNDDDSYFKTAALHIII